MAHGLILSSLPLVVNRGQKGWAVSDGRGQQTTARCLQPDSFAETVPLRLVTVALEFVCL